MIAFCAVCGLAIGTQGSGAEELRLPPSQPATWQNGYTIGFTQGGLPHTPPSGFAAQGGFGGIGALQQAPPVLAPPPVTPLEGSVMVPDFPHDPGAYAATRLPVDPRSLESSVDRYFAAGVSPGSAAPAIDTSETVTDEAISLAADGAYKDGIYLLDLDYIGSWVDNSWRIATGPARYDRDDWLNLAGVAGVVGIAFLADEAIQDFIQDDLRSDTTDSISDALSDITDIEYLALGAAGGYALAELAGAKREKAAALLSLESLLLTALTNNGLKYAIGRKRPSKTDDRFDFSPFTDVNSSFPSGHTSHTFAVATVLSEIYGEDEPWVPWAAYGFASAVGLARVNNDRHWISDVLAGGALGYFIGKMVVRFNPFLAKQGLAVRPFARSGAQGVGLSYQF